MGKSDGEVAICIKLDEFCINNDGFCIKQPNQITSSVGDYVTIIPEVPIDDTTQNTGICPWFPRFFAWKVRNYIILRVPTGNVTDAVKQKGL